MRPTSQPGHEDESPVSRRRLLGIYGLAVLLTIALFGLHVTVIFDVIGELLRFDDWLRERVGANDTGKIVLAVSFFTLLLTHFTEAAVWGGFFRATRLLPTLSAGIYFAASSITTVGYGDVVLKYPWRHLGALIAISGVLMFGCSTAFLFVILQRVWHHL